MSDTMSSVTADAFRLAMRHLAGTVSVLQAEGRRGRTGCTITSMQPFSLEPPCILLCLNEGGTTAKTLREVGRFTVSVLSEAQRQVAQVFSGQHGTHGEARFSASCWEPESSSRRYVSGCLLGLACETDHIVERHGHLLVIGRVTAMHGLDTTTNPLLYHEGQYGRWSE